MTARRDAAPETEAHTESAAEPIPCRSDPTPRQIRQLDFRLKRDSKAARTPISKRGHNGPVRLSSAQAALWHFCRREDGNSAYTIPRVFEIQGPLDVGRLGLALSRVVERHEILRTAFEERDGNAVQIVQPAQPVLLPVIDIPAADIDTWLRVETARPMDPATGPLLHAHLARVGSERHFLVLLWHHLVSDQSSARILDEEIGRLYNGEELPDPPVQYGDFAEWEPTVLQMADLEKRRDFWKSFLSGAPPAIDLPFGRTRPAEAVYKGHVHVFDLDPALGKQLRAFSVKRRVTFFPIFLAAWALLLSRYSGRQDLVVGVPVAGRDAPELEQVIGYFVKLLPLRLQVLDTGTFEDLVRECWARFLQCSECALPFEAILNAVRPERSRSYAPLFQVVLNFLRERGRVLQLEGTATKKVSSQNGTSRPLDLALTVLDRDDGIRVILEYSTALFDLPAIQQMAGHFVRILSAATLPETLRLGEIAVLNSGERHAVLYGRNATEELWPVGETVLTWFNRHAIACAGKIAIRSGEVEWSRGQLHSFAGRVTRALEAEGIQPGDVVAVNAERSPETIGVLLGIWKRGAVWLPIDTRWPPARRQFVYEDSGAKIMIDNEWLRRLPPHPSRSSDLGKDTPLRPDLIAYVLYTSGSTGQPKGVPVRHESLLNCLLSLQRRPGFTADDTVLSLAPLSFDMSMCEIALTFISGAKLILPDITTVTAPRAVKRLLEQNNITIALATPTLWRSLREEGWKGSPGLRVWCGGEALPPELAESLLDRAREVWNLYGPTETTMCSTVHRVSRGESPVPIGRPIANTQCYVLDANLQPVPDGVPGELFIAGAGVVAGYVGHAQDQMDRFPSNPFVPGDSVPGGRMYRTGDIALWLQSGDLVFLHREDMQVKVRGQRIELGEVETILGGLPGIRQAVAGVQDEALVAWVVPSGPDPWDPAQLRTELRARLPEYMVPGILVRVERLPLNSSGKVDRKKLARAERPSATSQSPHTAAGADSGTGLMEQALRDLWEETLDVRPVRLEDNFFDLGGHSLLASRLFARIERVFGRRLPESVLVQAPTIAGLASILRSQTGRGFRSLVPIQPLGDRPPFFCVPGMDGGVLRLRDLGRFLGPDQPAYGLEAVGTDGMQPAHFRVEEMAGHFIREMRQLQPEGPYYVGGYCFGGLVAFEIARQLAEGGERVALLAILDGVVRWDAELNPVRRAPPVPGVMNHARENFQAWKPLPPREKISYVLSRAGDRLVRGRMGKKLFEVIYKDHAAADLPFLAGLYSVNVAHVIALRRYRPVPARTAVTLFKTTDHKHYGHDASLGWARLAPHVEIDAVPGSHITTVEPPHVKVLAARLKDRLRAAQAGANQTREAASAQEKPF